MFHIDRQDPHLQALLWTQVIGFPVAFMVRAVVLAFRSTREPAQARQVQWLRAVSNVFFALTSALFPFSVLAGVGTLTLGVGLTVRAFALARGSLATTRSCPATPARAGR